MTAHGVPAKGTFEVTLAPQANDAAEGAALGRLSIDKQFQGDLVATSKGEMLTARAEGGSAVYVAIERVTGTLRGRAGTFVLVHQGVMTAAGQQLTITVMEGSGTGQLAGLGGTMNIIVDEGRHSYDLAYTLP